MEGGMDIILRNPDNYRQMADSINKEVSGGNVVVSSAVQKVPPVKKVDIDREPTISRSELADKIELLNAELKSSNQAVMFSSDPTTGRDIVKVTNRSTGELIRQIPSIEALKAMQNMDLMMGLIFNKST
jgi:flagellar protein FlaG